MIVASPICDVWHEAICNWRMGTPVTGVSRSRPCPLERMSSESNQIDYGKRLERQISPSQMLILACFRRNLLTAVKGFDRAMSKIVSFVQQRPPNLPREACGNQNPHCFASCVGYIHSRKRDGLAFIFFLVGDGTENAAAQPNAQTIKGN